MQSFRFSTDSVTAEQAVSYWGDSVLPQLGAQLTEVEPLGFSCTLEGRRRPELAMAKAELTAYSGMWHENARLIGSENSLRIFRVHQGELRMVSHGQEHRITAGGAFVSGPEAITRYALLPRTGGRTFVGDMTTIPMHRLETFGAKLRRDLACPLPDSALGALINSYVNGLRADDTPDRFVIRMADNFAELLAATLGQVVPHEFAATAMLDGIYHRASEYLRKNYTDPKLHAGTIAKALGISERSLFRAFEQREETFHTYLLRWRIDAAARHLRFDRKSKIASIALDSGFDSLATFNRAFRAQIGCCPSEFRSQFEPLATCAGIEHK